MIFKNKNSEKEGASSHPPKNGNNTSQKKISRSDSPQKVLIVIKYDVGFSNTLYIRGNGEGLSWDKGQPLKNIKADEWVWEKESKHPFEFKTLINDLIFEEGDNHKIDPGTSLAYTPTYPR